MAELMHFQPGKAFYDAYQGARGNTLAKLAITGEGEQRKSALADLYGLDPSLASQAQAQIGKNDEQDYSELVQSAKVMYSLKGRPEADMMWQRVAPKFSQKYGIQFNPTPQPSDWDAIEKIVQATGASGQAELPADIRTNQWYLDQLGYKKGSDDEKAFLKMRAGQMPKAVPYNFKYDDYGNAYIEDKNKGTLSQAGTGASTQQPATMTLEQISATADKMFADGASAEEVNSWSAQQVAAYELAKGAGNSPYGGQQTNQARINTKPEGQMTEYQARMLALSEQRQAQAAADRKAKVDLANQKKGDAEQKRNEAVIMSVDDTLNTIDRLEKSPGYAELGTAFGDIKLKTPLVRSDVKDANATLKTLAGQIALSTMANLKTLSASGATGFGALTAPELSLLQNSIATLQQEDVSNSQIVESIRVIKEKMAKIKQSAIGSPAPKANTASPNSESGSSYSTLWGD